MRSAERRGGPAGRVRRALVIGGGIAGCGAAVLLARGGVEVDLVEKNGAVSAVGSGITLLGNAVRVLAELGVWEQVRDAGFVYGGVDFVSADGAVLGAVSAARSSGGLPDGVGIYRPKLSSILSQAAVGAGGRMS